MGMAPGWYPAPGGEPVQRWWDGSAWSSATLPLSAAPLAVDPPRWRGRLRQLAWASVPVWSLGLLAFVPSLRLAIARQTRKDWTVFVGYLAAVGVILALAGAGAAFFPPVTFVLMALAATHALVAFRPATDLFAETASWSASLPNRHALAAAQARMQRRQETRELVRATPALARELRVGRPDLPRHYDDGGLIDVNHAPIEIIAAELELTPKEVTAIDATRGQLGRFSSPEELVAYAQLEPDRVDGIRDLLWFG